MIVSLDQQQARARTTANLGARKRLARPADPRVWQRVILTGLTPQRLRGIENRAKRGDVEELAELYSEMLRDPIVREPLETRNLAVASGEIEILPPTSGGEGFTDGVANAVSDMLRLAPNASGTIAQMTGGEGVGWSIHEHRWRRVHGMWVSSPERVEPRDVRFGDGWRVELRSYQDGRAGRWGIHIDEHPHDFLRHIPAKMDRPTVAGDLLACAWDWLYGRWAEIYRQQVMERHGAPIIIGKIVEEAPQEAVDALYDALEELTQRRYGVASKETEIQLLEPVGKPGEVFADAIQSYRTSIANVLLGADLTFEAAGTAGGRALGESLFATKVLPRFQAMAKNTAASIERGWVVPFLALNSHLFGGVTPPTPQIRIRLLNELPDAVTPQDIHAGLPITANEYRAAKRLPPRPKRSGGDELVKPQAMEAAKAAAGTLAPQPRGQLALPIAAPPERPAD